MRAPEEVTWLRDIQSQACSNVLANYKQFGSGLLQIQNVNTHDAYTCNVVMLPTLHTQKLIR